MGFHLVMEDVLLSRTTGTCEQPSQR